MVKEVESLAELEKAFTEAGSKAVLVDFHATWCGPCKTIAPILSKLADETPSMVVLKVDVDKAPDIAEKYDIQAMPTFKVFKNGQEVETAVGGNPSNIEALFKKYK
jgi:thioredoxin 1